LLHIAYYEADIATYCNTDEQQILGALTKRHGFALEPQQRNAWIEQICILKRSLADIKTGWVFFEFSIPRMGKRADVVLVIGGVIFVLEFKVGADTFDRAALEQAHDYALDLKNFHRGSHHLSILPILVATKALPKGMTSLHWAEDQVAEPVGVCPSELANLIDTKLAHLKFDPIEPSIWARSGYQPTPTIVEAAQALYRDHNVREISRSDAGAKNLGDTTDCLTGIIEHSKRNHRKAICFVTGVPGAGKTLAGLNIATTRAKDHSDEHAVFLSGNGPLVDVLREALARDESRREGISKSKALRKVVSFVQNIHHFRDEALKDSNPPDEKVVVFDEAQRAWGREQTTKFMQQKRGYLAFEDSEPAFLIRYMDRHDDWCVIICLVGGGQEINTGEAGLAEWLFSISKQFTAWDVYSSYRLDDPDYIWDEMTIAALSTVKVERKDALHLGVSMRSFRAESLSDFTGHVVENRPDQARQAYEKIAERYPIVITRNLNEARSWLRDKARGSERFGLIASSGANRLRLHKRLPLRLQLNLRHNQPRINAQKLIHLPRHALIRNPVAVLFNQRLLAQPVQQVPRILRRNRVFPLAPGSPNRLALDRQKSPVPLAAHPNGSLGCGRQIALPQEHPIRQLLPTVVQNQELALDLDTHDYFL
jgi:hypothetical protein